MKGICKEFKLLKMGCPFSLWLMHPRKKGKIYKAMCVPLVSGILMSTIMIPVSVS